MQAHARVVGWARQAFSASLARGAVLRQARQPAPWACMIPSSSTATAVRRITNLFHAQHVAHTLPIRLIRGVASLSIPSLRMGAKDRLLTNMLLLARPSAWALAIKTHLLVVVCSEASIYFPPSICAFLA